MFTRFLHVVLAVLLLTACGLREPATVAGKNQELSPRDQSSWSIVAYGNHCGSRHGKPWWPVINALDAACKKHDDTYRSIPIGTGQHCGADLTFLRDLEDVFVITWQQGNKDSQEFVMGMYYLMLNLDCTRGGTREDKFVQANQFIARMKAQGITVPTNRTELVGDFVSHVFAVNLG